MATQTFNSKYRAILERNGTRLCIGLDTDWQKVPEFLHQAENVVLEFNTAIVNATHDLCCAYKMNLAFYENFGEAGIYALHRTLARIPTGVLSIGDAKRGDIGNTAEKYAHTMLEIFDFDAVTVNPYMGIDTLDPYFRYPGKCVFVLALTSNPGSHDFQRKMVDGTPLYREVIDRCMDRYGDSGSLGFVVGATHPDELAEIREAVGAEIPLLIPGLGTQGGDAQRTTRANNGGVAFFNVSRAIIEASCGEDFSERARSSAIAFVEQLSETVGA